MRGIGGFFLRGGTERRATIRIFLQRQRLETLRSLLTVT